MVANPIRFQPLDGLPDADERGAGTFLFDDGTSMVAEDPELASLVKSYQDTIPEAQNLQTGLSQVPDMRTADLGVLSVLSPQGTSPHDDAISRALGGNSVDPNFRVAPDSLSDITGVGRPGQSIDEFAPKPAEPPKPVIGDDSQAIGRALGGEFTPPTPTSLVKDKPAAPVTGANVPMPAGAQAEPSDSQNAAELHRIAAQQALRGGYVQGRPAGWQDAQRTGALDPEVAQRQGSELASANQSMLGDVERARQGEADVLRQSALQEAMRLTVQREEQQRLQREAEEKRQRLLAERRRVNDAEIDTTFAQGDSFRQVLAVLGSALLGAIGSDAGLRMIESNIDRHVRKEMQIRGSKLQALAEEIGSEEQVVAGAKAKIYDLLDREAKNNQKNLDAAGIENQTPAVLAQLKKQMLAEEQGFERESLGKKTEVYQQAVRGGRTGPNLDAAAKHYEAAAKASGAGKEMNKQERDAKRGLAKIKRIRDTLVRGEKTGSAASVVGWQDKIGLNSVQDYFGGLPPDQAEQAMALGELQVENLGSTAREFNNQKAQNLLQSMGVPKNDRDIPLAIARLNQIIEAEESDFQNTAPKPVEVR
jgi:hypothetical protein